MLSDELITGLAFLEAHKDEHIARYCETLKRFYEPEKALAVANVSYNGLISRLKGTPLQADKMSKPVREAVSSGHSSAILIESATALYHCLKEYLDSFPPVELKPEVKEALIYRADKILKQMITNIQMATLKQTLADMDNSKRQGS
jgi:hypothetical protein